MSCRCPVIVSSIITVTVLLHCVTALCHCTVSLSLCHCTVSLSLCHCTVSLHCVTALCHCHCVTALCHCHCATVTVSLYCVLFVLYDDPPCLLAGGHRMSHGTVHCCSVPPSLDHLGRHLTALSPHQVAPVGTHQLTVTLCPPFPTGTLHPHSSHLHSHCSSLLEQFAELPVEVCVELCASFGAIVAAACPPGVVRVVHAHQRDTPFHQVCVHPPPRNYCIYTPKLLPWCHVQLAVWL